MERKVYHNRLLCQFFNRCTTRTRCYNIGKILDDDPKNKAMMDFLTRRMNGLAGEILFISSAVAMVAVVRRQSNSLHRRSFTAASTRHMTSSISAKTAPIARKRRDMMYFGKHPEKLSEFRGSRAMDPPIVRYDDYNWMRDESRKDEAVLSLIREENDYCEQQMEPLDSLKKSLYESMVGYMKETDEEVPYVLLIIDALHSIVICQVPYLRDDFYYYTKTVQGLSYKLHCRYHKSLGFLDSESPKDATTGDRSHSVILDENEIAKGVDYCDITTIQPSPSQNKLIYGVDRNGIMHFDCVMDPNDNTLIAYFQAQKCMKCI